jgi:hypothetical protein
MVSLMTDREWRWTRNGNRWIAEVLPDGPDVVRLIPSGIGEWDKIKDTSFGPGDCLVVKHHAGDIVYMCVGSGKGDVATFRLRQ